MTYLLPTVATRLLVATVLLLIPAASIAQSKGGETGAGLGKRYAHYLPCCEVQP